MSAPHLLYTIYPGQILIMIFKNLITNIPLLKDKNMQCHWLVSLYLLYSLYVFGQIGLSKHCRQIRCHGIWHLIRVYHHICHSSSFFKYNWLSLSQHWYFKNYCVSQTGQYIGLVFNLFLTFQSLKLLLSQTKSSIPLEFEITRVNFTSLSSTTGPSCSKHC